MTVCQSRLMFACALVFTFAGTAAFGEHGIRKDNCAQIIAPDGPAPAPARG
jgi:hypothetical protein